MNVSGRHGVGLLVVALCVGFLGSAVGEEVRYSVAIPVAESTAMYVQVGQDGTHTPLTSSLDGCVHQATIAILEDFPSSPPYRFGMQEFGRELEWEPFWRVPESCRVRETSGSITFLQNEVFNQTESTLGLPPLPYLQGPNGESLSSPEGVRPPQIPYIDDNQVATFSMWASPLALDVLLDPNSYGGEYVKANLSYVSLASHQRLVDIDVKRSGGSSINSFPYSFQVKMSDTENLGGVTRRFKLKSFAKDYPAEGGWSCSILLEKTADDMCQVLEAPINYMSLVRVYINGVYYGVYGALEKIDEHFVERRWPFNGETSDVGSLYKAETTEFYMLNSTGWVPGRREYFTEEGDYGDVCCPCYENSCDVEDDCDVRDPTDVCFDKDCCSCPWAVYAKMSTQEANCEVQAPYYDFVSLGDAVTNSSARGINATLAVYGYLRSLACELTVMNVDGYLYHGFNYYWYKDVRDGKFHVITYDQDSSLSPTPFVTNPQENIWNFSQGLSDALFLPTIFDQFPEAKEFYDTLLAAFVQQFYRSDKKGPLYERTRILSRFLTKYNPGREDLSQRMRGYTTSMTNNSEKVQSDLGISSLPSVNHDAEDTCGESIPALL